MMEWNGESPPCPPRTSLRELRGQGGQGVFLDGSLPSKFCGQECSPPLRPPFAQLRSLSEGGRGALGGG
jgi:hypothetical protein